MYLNNLKRLREEKELTQQTLSTELGFKRSTYNSWERNEVMIPLKKADKLSSFYKVSFSYIYGISNKLIYDNNIKEFDYDILLKNLNKLRKENNDTYEVLGKILDCTRQTSQRYFSGEIIIPIDILIKLSKYYKIDIDTLCGKNDKVLEPIK